MPRRSPYMQNNKKPEDVLKALASIATSAAAEPVSGLGGILAGVMTNDSKKGADAVSRIQDAMTYQPSSVGVSLPMLAKMLEQEEQGNNNGL